MAHHEEGAVAAGDTGSGEARAPGGDFGVEFGERKGEVVDIAGAGAAARDFEGGAGRVCGGHEGEVARNVGIFGRRRHEWTRSSEQGTDGGKEKPRRVEPTGRGGGDWDLLTVSGKGGKD